MRYVDWSHLRFKGDPQVAKAYLPEARKYLGLLDAQRPTLGDGAVVSRHLTNADGVKFHVAFYGGQPHIEIDVRGVGGRGARNTLMMGFVAQPYPSLGDFGAVLLVDDGKPGSEKWVNLFFDADYFPTDPGDPNSGQYRKNRNGDFVFLNGLRVAGNLDWRDAKEEFVVSFFGSTDRYFGYTDGITFDTRVFVNGDCLVDLHWAADLDGMSAKILGACVRKTDDGFDLVWCAGIEENLFADRHAQLRFYRAPLKRKLTADLQWCDAPPAVELLRSPRFAAILSEAQTLPGGPPAIDPFYTHSFGAPLTGTKILGGHLMAFNQAATEGKMILRAGNTPSAFRMHEITFNFEEFETPTFDDTAFPETFAYTDSSTTTDTNVTLAATREIAPDEGGPGIDGEAWAHQYQAYTDGGTVFHTKLAVVSQSTGRTITPDYDEIPAAVDYKDNVPVYAYTIPPSSTGAGSNACSPTQSASYDNSGPNLVIITDAANTATATYSGTGITNGIRVPWLVDPITGASSEDRDGSASQSAHLEEDSGDPSAYDLTFTGSGSDTTTVMNTYVVVHYCDLRNDTLVHSLFKVTVETVLTIGPFAVFGDPSNRDVKRSRSADVTTTRTLDTRVQINGTTLYTSGEVALDSVEETIPLADETLLGSAVNGFNAATIIGWRTGLNGYISISGAVADMPSQWNDLVAAWGGEASFGAGGGFFAIGTINTGATATLDDSSSSSTDVNASFYTGSAKVYDGAAPLDWAAIGVDGKPAYGYWPTRKGDYALSMPWPDTDAAERWLNHINGGDLDLLAGHHNSKFFYPIWLTTRFAYEHATN